MITPTEITQKARQFYLPFLRFWMAGERFFPLQFPVGALPLNYTQLRASVQLLIGQAKEQLGYGYTLEFETTRTRKYEMQTLPRRVLIETEQDFLRLIGKERECNNFQHDYHLIQIEQPALCSWLIANPQRIIDHHGHWEELLEVCSYFINHPRPQCYIRELPVHVHTKFIEQHTGILRELLDILLSAEAIQEDAGTFAGRFGLREDELLVRIRLLDNQLATRYGLPLTDLSIPHSQFARLELRGDRCIITENKMVFLALPSFLRTFAIFGGGFMVSYLRGISWLVDCPMYYWGDLDAHGFQILSSLRGVFPHVTSCMMDERTLQAFSEYRVQGVPCTVQSLPYLTGEEHTLFQHLARENIRLEQERITHSYAIQCLNACLE